MPAVGRSLSEAHSRTLPPGRSLSDTGSQTFSVRTVGCWQVRCSLVVSGIRFWLKAVLGSKLCFSQHLDRRAAMANSQCCEPCEYLPIEGCLPDFLKQDEFHGEWGFHCELCNAWCQSDQPWDVRTDSHLMSEAHFRRMGRWLLGRYGQKWGITWANLLDCFDDQRQLPNSWALFCEKFAKQQKEWDDADAAQGRRQSNPKGDSNAQENSAWKWQGSRSADSGASWSQWAPSHEEPKDDLAKEVQRVGADLAKLQKELHEKVERLEADLAPGKVGVEKIGRLEADIAAGKAEVRRLEARLGAPAPIEVSERLERLEAKLSTAQVEAQKIERLEADSATAKVELVKIERLEVELTAAKVEFKKIERLETMLADTLSKVEKIERARADVANSQVQVDNMERLEADAPAAQAEVKDALTKHLEKKVERLEADLLVTQAETEKIRHLESKLAAAEAKIEKLELRQDDSAAAAAQAHDKIEQLEAATADCSREVAACSAKASELEGRVSVWQTGTSDQRWEGWHSWRAADGDTSGDARGRGRAETRGAAARQS